MTVSPYTSSVCMICKKKFKVVSASHVAKHGMTTAQYFAKYGESGKGEFKTCTGCKQVKHKSEFHFDKVTKGGARRRAARCRKCYNKACLWNGIKCNYNLTQHEYYELLTKQNNRCGICFKKAEETKMFIDHCHHTGKVRGFLCLTCNTGIGYLRDDLAMLDKAKSYLLGNNLACYTPGVTGMTTGKDAPRKLEPIRQGNPVPHPVE